MELKNETGIIISHMAPYSCLKEWSTRFQALMDRYQHLIRFSLYGHTHSEKFFLTRSVSNINGNLGDTRPIGINLALAPTTTYQDKHPSFAVYDIDEETMLITNITTYYFNITEANAKGTLYDWQVYHNILQDFGMKDCSPSSFQSYAKNVLTNETLAI